MVEKISRSKDTNIIKTVEEREEDKARTHLQPFLSRNYRGVRAMRSHTQILSGRMNVDVEQLARLEAFVKNKSRGGWLDKSLCEITEGGEQFRHDVTIFGRELERNAQVIRGFYFKFLLNGRNFEFVDLDGGRSREYFDSKDAEGKRKFIRRFADRRRNSAIYMGDPKNLPFGFTAFISDAGGKFIIEDVVSYRDRTPPSRRKRK